MLCFDCYYRCTEGEQQPCPDSLSDLGYPPRTVELELEHLLKDYGSLAYGRRQKAPCGAWRAEQNLLQDHQAGRFTNRVHVYQQTGIRETPFGNYVGYVSLRPPMGKRGHASKEKYRYTIVANLTPPFHMQRPRYHIITCLAGPPDGVLPFSAAPFCVPRHDTKSRASCAHMALHQALLLKAEQFGFCPITSQDLLNALWEQEKQRFSGKARTLDQISHDGCTLEEVPPILSKANAGGVLETFLDHEPHHDYEVVRCLTDYLANDLPVIAELEHSKRAKRHHAVLVLGMHLLQDAEDKPIPGPAPDTENVAWAELPGRLVVHDVGEGPFCEMQTAAFLKKAWFRGKPEDPCSLSFLALAPLGTQVGIKTVRARSRRFVSTRAWMLQQFRDQCAAEDLTPDGLRYVTRLLKSWQVEQWYLQKASNARPPVPGDRNRYCWCVEVRLPRGKGAAAGPGKNLLFPLFVLVWGADALNREQPDLALVLKGEQLVSL